MTLSFSLALLLLAAYVAGEGNLSCYQCMKTIAEPCPEDTLLPCPESKDRCVTHISKDATKGFVMKKECGLGPCGFSDDMVNKGLGLDQCDTSKDEYFCVFCCKESGCNNAAILKIAQTLFGSVLLFIMFRSCSFF